MIETSQRVRFRGIAPPIFAWGTGDPSGQPPSVYALAASNGRSPDDCKSRRYVAAREVAIKRASGKLRAPDDLLEVAVAAGFG